MKEETFMKHNRTLLPSIVVVVLLVLPLAAPATTLAQAPSDASTGVFPPDAIVFGQTYGQWSAAWWQWNFSIPVSSNPSYDTTGQNCRVRQTQPVFFLAGDANFSPAGVTRACSVPSQTPLFFPLINVECSNVESRPFFGGSDQARLKCAERFMDDVGINTLKATIDRVDVQTLSQFRFHSPPFDFTMPAQDNILGLHGVTSGRSESDGFWLMVKPLSPGRHVLHFAAAFVSGIAAGLAQNVTYNLTVMP